jgi:hypothetical protein
MKNAFIIYTGLCINPQMWICNEIRNQYFMYMSQIYINCKSRESSVSLVNMLQAGGPRKLCLTSGNSKRYTFLCLSSLCVNCKINETITITVNTNVCVDGILYISFRLRDETRSEYRPACSLNVSRPHFTVIKRPVREADDS